MPMLDLGPTAAAMAGLVRTIPDDALDRPTPCEGMSLGALLDHVGGFAVAFRLAAMKDRSMDQPPPTPDAAGLTEDWRTEIPEAVHALAEAWRDPEAWTGTTRVGGQDLPGEMAGVVALDELVLHGWDVARATGRPYDCDEASLQAVHAFVQQWAAPEMAEQRHGLFGPAVAVEDDAPLLDRVVGLAGRDPHWMPT